MKYEIYLKGLVAQLDESNEKAIMLIKQVDTTPRHYIYDSQYFRFISCVTVIFSARGGTSSQVQVRSHLLLQLWRELARSRQMSPDQEMDQEVRRRQRDQQLDLSQHQGVSQGKVF